MVVSTVLRSRLVIVRRASGTTAPEESVTVPATLPYTAWAEAGRVGQDRASRNVSDAEAPRRPMTRAFAGSYCMGAATLGTQTLPVGLGESTVEITDRVVARQPRTRPAQPVVAGGDSCGPGCEGHRTARALLQGVPAGRARPGTPPEPQRPPPLDEQRACDEALTGWV